MDSKCEVDLQSHFENKCNTDYYECVDGTSGPLFDGMSAFAISNSFDCLCDASGEDWSPWEEIMASSIRFSDNLCGLTQQDTGLLSYWAISGGNHLDIPSASGLACRKVSSSDELYQNLGLSVGDSSSCDKHGIGKDGEGVVGSGLEMARPTLMFLPLYPDSNSYCALVRKKIVLDWDCVGISPKRCD